MSPEVFNIVLDGSSADLEAKYGHLFEKRKNVPVIMACNKVPKYDSLSQTEAFNTRVTECEFSSYSDARGHRPTAQYVNSKEDMQTVAKRGGDPQQQQSQPQSQQQSQPQSQQKSQEHSPPAATLQKQLAPS